jgi:signal transduction histidine kinase
VRELLSNAIRHSQAKKVEVKVSALLTSCVVRVIDDGVGFKEGVLRSGLANLELRAEKLEGNFDIHALPRGGTEAVWSAKL